jgi:Glycine cleavage system P-protein
MSALLKRKCLFQPRSKISSSGLYSSEFTQLRCWETRPNGLLPLITKVQTVVGREYITTAARKRDKSNAYVESPVSRNNFLRSRPILASQGITPLSRKVGKRYQHAHAMESTEDVDHEPIISSYPEWIKPQDTLPRRHIGPSDEEITIMLESLKQPNLEAFVQQTIPNSIRASKEFKIPSEQTPETEMLDELTKAGKANSAAEVDTYIGMGYHPTITPGVIKRNVLENPGWYTSYTPYQPEISQGKSIII